MQILTINLNNFRNYIKRNFEFEKNGVNVIIGPNGSGKTNILEAIHVLSLGKSARNFLERDLINVDSDYARVSGVFDNKDKLEVVLERRGNTKRVKKTYKINHAIKTGPKFIGYSKSVLFMPDDIGLVAGSPSRRRDYLDGVLSQSHIEYRKNILKYNRILKHRNKLLDLFRGQTLSLVQKAQLAVWDKQLINTGEMVQNYRESFFRFANERLPVIGSALYRKKYRLVLKYEPQRLSERSLEKVYPIEISRGTTQVGPHRDDYEFILIDGFESHLKGFGSRGEQRTAVLCLKILEIEYLTRINNNIPPILLLDDIFSELDTNYRGAILNVIKNQQTFITTADKNMVPKSILETSCIISL